MVKELLEGYRGNELYMDGLKDELNSKYFILYGNRVAVQKYKAQIEKFVDECLSRRKKIFDIIDKIQDPLMKRIFWFRFIELKSNQSICREVGYSTYHLSRMINKEIKNLEKLEQ